MPKLHTRTFGHGIWKFIIHFYVTVTKRHPKPITMYDSVTVAEIPLHAKAVAGYVDGLYKTFPILEAHFPKAHKLSIAVSASHDAHCLDIETGDATIVQAEDWVKRQHARGVKRPVVYTEASRAQDLLNALADLPRDSFRLWTAHYTQRQHFCSSACTPGFRGEADATQYRSTTSPNLDTSICRANFFTA